jgi:hypothetical protein
MVTQADIDALNQAIASGTRQVVLGGQSVTYQTTDALIRARNDLRAELQAMNATRRRSRMSYLYLSGRGYD